jgi:Circadian oscillating protein COP23
MAPWQKFLLGLFGAGTAIALSFQFNLFSHNTITVNPAPEPRVAHSSAAYCQKDNIDDFYVMSKVGTKDKPIIKIETGQEFWGDKFTKGERCSQIVGNYNLAKDKGATGWATATKGGYPIICPSTNKGCLVDKDSIPLQLATFKRTVNAKPLVEKLLKQTNPGYEGSDAGSISTGSDFHYFHIP